MKLRLRKELTNKEKWRLVMSYFREHPQLMMEVMPQLQSKEPPLIDGGDLELKAQEEVDGGEYYVGGASTKKAGGTVYEHYLKL